MPQIVMGPSQTGTLDSSVKKQAYAFLEKLAENDALPGLHIEPIGGAVDERVRTGRVNDFYRAVLFKVQGQGKEAHYVYLGVLPHDDAISFAGKARLSVNPVNGIAELLVASDDEIPAAPAAPAPVGLSTVATEPESLLEKRGFDLPALADDLGLDPSLARAALDACTEDKILRLAEHAVDWQGLALIDLVAGTPMSIVKQTLSIGVTQAEPAAEPELEAAGESAAPAAAPAHEAADDDTKLIAALQHPAARLQFAFIEDDEELRRAVEESDFAAWRVFLHPEQRKYATRSYNGPFRLSGGAGTGKTVVLLHRARHLARENPAARILLTTYTRTLAEAMQRDLHLLDPTLPLAARPGEPGICVMGIDALARSVVTWADGVAADVEAVLGPRSAQISGRTANPAWRDAGASVPDLPAELRSPAFLSAEYAQVILPARVTTRDAYLIARRSGRGVALDRKKRIAVWSAVEAYRSQAGIEGRLDFVEVPAIAAAHLERTGPSASVRFDHALIDEGQDLTPAHWQFLRMITCPGPNDLFIAEDSHQRIYGQPVVLGRYGVAIVGRSQRLRLNYRTTAENLRYAVGALEGVQFVDLEDAEEEARYRSARSGPAPRVLVCSSLGEELDAAAKAVTEWLGQGVTPETIGILVRDTQQAQQLTRGLADRGVQVRRIDQNAERAGRPLVLTMHRAKGMEFARVLLAGVNEGLIPAAYLLQGLAEADRDDALLRERSLLYVAMTRARDELVITTGGAPSPLLPQVTR